MNNPTFGTNIISGEEEKRETGREITVLFSEVDSNLYNRFESICRRERRSIENQILHLIEKFVSHSDAK